jgi:membrane protein required for colicin V production
MNMLDMIVVGVVVLSGLFAFVRGFVREALSIFAWIGAGAVAYYGYDKFEPTVKTVVTNPLIAQVATVSILFVVSLLVFSVVVGMLSSRVRSSFLGSLDRSLGLVFGLARGCLVICLAYIVMVRILTPDPWPPKQEDLPPWIAQASLRPYLERGSTPLIHMIPAKLYEKGTSAATAIGDAARDGELSQKAGELLKNSQNPFDALPSAAPQPQQTAPAQPLQPQGYAPEQSREMNRAIEQSTDGSK